MLRNNLTTKISNIPFIDIYPHFEWKNTMIIDAKKGFSIEDLYIILKSYSDSLICIPTQLLVKVEDHAEKSRIFFTDSLSINKLKNTSFEEFIEWYSERWLKDSEYIGHEIFSHFFIIKYIYFNKEPLYPIYPWNESTNYIINKENILNAKIKKLENKIIELENQLYKK